ncbi:MAG TPA: hypothetical protein VK934_06450 [Fimbriimonas sp.]|nr:hypothetical protein [Fimbriimonas sp.]
MIQALVTLGFATGSLLAQPFPVKFARELSGRGVLVSVNGAAPHAGFAGKLAMQAQNGRTVASVCANPGAPVVMGQVFPVRRLSSRWIGGRIAGAGNIVSKYFMQAQTADQCAALQLAVWEAVSDGGPLPDFEGGRFQAGSTDTIMELAAQFYDAFGEPGDAIFLQTGEGGGQDQLMPPLF